MNRINSRFKRITALFMVLSLFFGIFGNMGVPLYAAENAAKIGDTEYATLEDALAAASNGATVYILKDITIKSTLNITKTVTLYVKDVSCNISRSEDMTDSIFDVTGALTLAGNGGTLTVNGNGVSAKAPLIKVSGGELTMKSGSSVSGGINTAEGGAGVEVVSGRFNFYGGTIRNNSASGFGNAVYTSESASVYLSGGASIGGSSDIYLPVSAPLTIAGELTGSGVINVNTDNATEGSVLATLANGADISEEQLKRFTVKSGDYTYSLTKSGSNLVLTPDTIGDNAARIGEVMYPTLEEAFAAAEETEDATITLVANTVVTSTITTSGIITLESDGDFTVTRSASLTGAPMFSIPSGSGLVIGDIDNTITLSGGSVESSASLIEVKGSLTTGNAVVITNNRNTTQSSEHKGAVSIRGGSFTMNGGIISGNNSAEGTVYLESGGFVMNGGEIKANTASVSGGVYALAGRLALRGGSIYANEGYSVYTAVDFTLSGNASIFSSTTYPAYVYLATDKLVRVVSGWGPAEAPEGYTNVISLTGQSVEFNKALVEFETSPSADFFKLAPEHVEKFGLVVKGNTLTVSSSDEVYTVYINDEPYISMNDGAKTLTPGAVATIRIVNDAQLSSTIVIPSGATVTVTTDVSAEGSPDYTSRSIRRSAEFNDAMFLVEAGATLVLTAAEGKNLILDGESRSVARAAVVVNGNLVISKGAAITANFNNASENIASSAFTYGGGVYADTGAVCTVSGGNISNCYASYGAGVFTNNSTLTMDSGEISGNVALFGGGVYLRDTTTKEAAPITNSPTNEEAEEDEEEAASYNFVMTGGSLYGNGAKSNDSLKGSGLGGGVYIDNGAEFAFSGGSMNANTAAGGSAVCIGTKPAEDSEDSTEAPLIPVFELSGSAVIAANNNIYMNLLNIGYVTLTSDLTAQKDPIVLSVPSYMPQNTYLVKYAISELEDPELAEKENEEAAKKAIEDKIFGLDEKASEYFKVGISDNDKTILINTVDDNTSTRYKAGKHYNGLALYEEEEEENADNGEETETAEETEAQESETEETAANEEEEETEPEKIEYKPITLKPKGSFTSYYEMTYYPELYTDMKACITAPFPVGTRIVMIDLSDEKNPAYYAYEVDDKTVVTVEGSVPESTEDTEKEDDALPVPGTVEIGLKDFVKMGAVNEYYEGYTAEETEESEGSDGPVKITEKMLFIVDFENIVLSEEYTPEGNFLMTWNHYCQGETKEERIDISASIKQTEYTVTNENSSIVSVSADENDFRISYALSGNSAALAENSGVIMVKLIGDIFPKGSYFTDSKGNQYASTNRSSTITIPIPTDSEGNLIPAATIPLTLSNYYGTAILKGAITAMIFVSEDGEHYTKGTDSDAQSDNTVFELKSAKDYSVLVTEPDSEKKPYYKNLDSLKDGNLVMTVKGLCNKEEAEEFELSLYKKEGKEYVACNLNELFNVSETFGDKISMSTGTVSLELRPELKSIQGSEFRVAFTVGKAVEYIKVKLTD